MKKSPRKPQMASMLHTCVGFGGPKWAHKQIILIFPTNFKIPKGPKHANRTKSPAVRGSREGEGGGFTLLLPPPRRSGPLPRSFGWDSRGPLEFKKTSDKCVFAVYEPTWAPQSPHMYATYLPSEAYEVTFSIILRFVHKIL